MFRFLKDKLGGFLKSLEEEAEEEAKEIEKDKKKEEKKEKQKERLKKESKKFIEILTKVTEEQIEKPTEKTEISEEIGLREGKLKRESLFKKIKGKIRTIKITEERFNELFENLEQLLLENNVALEVVDKIKDDLKQKLIDIEIKKNQLEEEIRRSLKETLEEILIEPFDLIEKIKSSEKRPFVILFFGINGSGKTTTIAKIANLLKKNNLSSVLSASDTFRAASIEQLMKHGEALKTKIIHHTYGADPAAVAYDAIQYAKTHKIDVVLIDTAGRMHTKENLLREMEKITRVTKPDLKIFVGESITGNDATEQAKNFNQAVGIDAIILSKADVDEKGGAAISVGYVTGKPIIYLGIGQRYDDIEFFSKKKIIGNLGLD